MQYEPVIGLEVHVHLNTETKMFCANRNDPDETHPNVNVCPICLGHPGTLPTMNKKAVEAVLRIGLAANCRLAEETWFERKNYFYPDLPKGYQISQHEKPLCEHGEFLGVKITRVHLEEDAGRLVHADDGSTLVDYNRAGTPLMELVTEPDITSAERAWQFAKGLQMLLRYLGVSHANMEKGQMRVEVNISLKPKDKSQKSKAFEGLGTKVEVKNLNSFAAVRDAITYEIGRQTKVLDGGKEVVHETRGWDSEKGVTVSHRTKETSDDYRYFPEPDLPPFTVSKMFDIEALRASLPELPEARRKRFAEEYGLAEGDIAILIRQKALGEFFETVASELREWENVTHNDENAKRHYPELLQRTANLLLTRVVGIVGSADDEDIGALRITPENLAHLVVLLHDKAISSSTGDAVLKEMVHNGGDPAEIVKEKNLAQVSDEEALIDIVEQVVDTNSDAISDYKSGNKNALQFLVGQVMKESAGKADPGVARTMLEKRLNQ